MSRRRAKPEQLRHNWQFTGNREPSAWLRGAAAVKLRWIDANGFATLGPRIMTQLSPYRTLPGSREDRTCDRCRCYCPVGAPFNLLTVGFTAGTPGISDVILTGGLCDACADLEGGPTA